MQMQLKVLSGGHAGKLIAINHDKFMIGRSEGCHLRPKSDAISRRHCAIVQKDNRFLLVDLKSRNGTLVNDHLLEATKPKLLKDGDRIKIGNLEFIAVIVAAGLASTKKEEVKSVKQAAERTAQSSHPAGEEVDVSLWLEEADTFERRGLQPDTRNFQIAAAAAVDETITEIKADLDTHTDLPAKGKPGKLPPVSNQPSTANSRDAASEALRKFLGGRR